MTGRLNSLARLPRRQVLQWAVAASLYPSVSGCNFQPESGIDPAQPWAGFKDPVSPKTRGYGADPKYIMDNSTPEVPPWPLVLGEKQIAQLETIADAILPATPNDPPPSDVGIGVFFNEWLSAPYELQTQDRMLILPGLIWSEAIVLEKLGTSLSGMGKDAAPRALRAILDARKDGPSKTKPFIGRLRALVIGGYYTTEAGHKALGHVPATVVQEYGGPSPEAEAHLAAALDALGLPFPRDYL